MARVIRADRRGPARVPAVVHDASAHARALIERAEREAEAVHDRALEAGRQQARAELAAALRHLGEARERLLAELEARGVEIALQAAKRIVGAELTARPEQIRGSIAALLARLRRAQRIVLRLHPEDAAALGPSLAQLRAAGTQLLELELEPDPSLSRGGCVLVSDIGALDARVETQLAALARALVSEETPA